MKLKYVAVLALIAAQLTIAGPAHAVLGLERVTAVTATDSTSSKTLAVACPAGKVVIGGGGQLNGAIGNAVLNWMRPLPPTNQYEAHAAEDVGGYAGNWSLRVFAICASPNGVPGLEYKRVNTPDTETIAKCTPGKKVVGTGGEVNGGSPEAILEDMVPLADLSGVAVRTYPDPGSVVTWSTIAHAICANPLPGLELKVSAAGTGLVSIACPAGKQVHGTGSEILAGAGQHGHVVLDETVPSPARLTSVFTTAYEDIHNPPNGWTVRAYAICAT